MTFGPRRLFTIELPGSRTLQLGERPLVMGVVNVTPDSFSQGISSSHDSIESAVASIESETAIEPAAASVEPGAPSIEPAGPAIESAPPIDIARAIEAALRMEADGADLIDIGGESTRPGAESVPAREELARVLPVISALAGRLRVPISVDTYKADVAAAALDAGAAIINDISGLRYEPALAGVAARRGAALILMHMRGRPKTMYEEAVYEDLIGEIGDELRASMAAAAAGGVPIDRLILDPGIGFAKRASHSYGVLARLPELAAAVDRPLLVGPSRKSFLREASGGRPSSERDWATAAAVTAAVLGGAHIVRVHAVAEMVQVVQAAENIRRSLQRL